ncbi:MAG: metallophosphoesterase, partial [Candidatus Latescibacteria bacterium]|nr:metallophosphoesterase [Candidatus Latescibacterota bacterium]
SVAVLAHASLTALATPLAWIGYSWMGAVFLFFSISVVLDCYRFFMKAGGRLLGVKIFARMLPSPYYSVFVTAALTLAAAGYGFFAARRINVEWIHIPTSKLETTSDSFRIVQISDLHLGLLSDETRLRRLIEVIRSVQPDVVVSTGDLVDMQPDHLGKFADLLHELKPRFGKFAVTGNHEAYVGLDHALAFTRRAGFVMLSHDGINVNNVIHIVGVDDPAVSNRLKIGLPAEKDLLKRCPKEKFTVLLKHQPVVDPASLPWFDLQLSGHTHGGQIFPFTLFTKLVYPAKMGLSRVGEESWLYVSRGTGSWGPPIRFLAPPELTVIELRSVHATPGS